MKFIKTTLFALTTVMAASNVSAMTYDEANAIFITDATTVLEKSELPKPLYKGATIESVSVNGTTVIYKVVTKDASYFPYNINGRTTEEIAKGLEQNLKATFCTRPYINDLPVVLVMRFENGANPVSAHDSVMVNTKDACKKK